MISNRDQYPSLLNTFGYSIGLELGVFKGQFSKHILNGWNGTLYLVDVWRPLPAEEYDDISNNVFFEDAYKYAIENIKGFEDRAFMLRMSGHKAVNLFNDESLDFIYIDANHSYEAARSDIELWFPKIRPGGMISGHDYLPKFLFSDRNNKNVPILLGDELKYAGMFGVNHVVDEFVEEHNLKLNLTEEFLGTWWVVK